VVMAMKGVTTADLVGIGVTLHQCFVDENWTLEQIMNMQTTWEDICQMGLCCESFTDRVNKMPFSILTDPPISMTFDMFATVVTIDEAVCDLKCTSGEFLNMGATAESLIAHGLNAVLVGEMKRREPPSLIAHNLHATPADIEKLNLTGDQTDRSTDAHNTGARTGAHRHSYHTRTIGRG